MAMARPSIGLAAFQKAGALAVSKNRRAAEAAKQKREKGGADVVQYGSLACACFMMLWVIGATVVCALFTIRYLGLMEEDQSWYVLNGSVEIAMAKATPILQAAGEARDALKAAIEFGHVKTSYDYAAIERALAPVLLFKPYVRSIEIAFSDREAGLVISHKRGGDEGQRQLVLQSNADDCFLMGPEGCADLGVKPQNFPAWYTEAMFIKLNQGGGDDGAQGPSREKLLSLSKSAGAAEEWLGSPQLLSGLLEGGSDAGEIVWYPALRLMFREPLPKDWAAEPQSLAGRVTLEVAELTGELLRDARLGPHGRAYLVDRFGVVLSSLRREETLMIDKETASITFRRLVDLPDSDWVRLITKAFSTGEILPLEVREGSLAVAVQPLAEPLEMFAVVVMSIMEETTFKDHFVYDTMWVLSGFSGLPYSIAILVMTFAFLNSSSEFDEKGRPKASRMTRFMSTASHAANRASQAGGMVRRAAVRRSSVIGPPGMPNRDSENSQGSFGNGEEKEEKQEGEEEDEAIEGQVAVRPRKTFIANDLKFQQDNSVKGFCARCLRCCCGKGRQGADE